MFKIMGSLLKEVCAGTQSRNNAGTMFAGSVTGLCVHFPYTAYTHLPRDCATQGGLSAPILVKTVLDRHAQGLIQSRIQAIPQPRLLLSDDWRLFKLTVKNSLISSPP